MIFPAEYECSRSWLVRNSCANVLSAGLCAATNGGNKKKLVTATL